MYRVRIDLCFDSEIDPDMLFKEAEKLLSKAVRIVHKDGIVETTSIELHKCYHDEEPRKRCEIIKRIVV